jgi:hypothetical protein
LSIELPNKYSLEKIWGSNFAIIRSNGEFAVKPDVLKVACRKGIVVGFKVLEDGLDPEEIFLQKPESGYFILRTKSGELQQGLSKHAYIESLNAMGLKYIEPTPIESDERVWYGLDGC